MHKPEDRSFLVAGRLFGHLLAPGEDDGPAR
jgi:hypothetical protein